MLDFLLEADNWLFLLINGWYSDFFDKVMVYVSSKLFWLPFYLLLLYLVIREYKWKSVVVLLFVAILLTLTDQISVHLFKNVFQRLRPCHDEELALIVHTVKYCGGQFGFVSSHASNSFGIIVFIGVLLKDRYSWLPWVLLIWGLLIMYSRVYLGVHYPGDVLVGALLGAVLGQFTLLGYRYIDKNWLKK